MKHKYSVEVKPKFCHSLCSISGSGSCVKCFQREKTTSVFSLLYSPNKSAPKTAWSHSLLHEQPRKPLFLLKYFKVICLVFFFAWYFMADIIENHNFTRNILCNLSL